MKTAKAVRKKGKVYFVVLIILVVVAMVAGIAILLDAPRRKELQLLTIENIDFIKLMDGTYIGEYKAKKGDSSNVVLEVTILEKQVKQIRILKGALDKNGSPVKMKDGMTMADLFKRVMEKESLQVDAISGATLTSKAHLKALENALKQAQKE